MRTAEQDENVQVRARDHSFESNFPLDKASARMFSFPARWLALREMSRPLQYTRRSKVKLHRLRDHGGLCRTLSLNFLTLQLSLSPKVETLKFGLLSWLPYSSKTFIRRYFSDSDHRPTADLPFQTAPPPSPPKSDASVVIVVRGLIRRTDDPAGRGWELSTNAETDICCL